MNLVRNRYLSTIIYAFFLFVLSFFVRIRSMSDWKIVMVMMMGISGNEMLITSMLLFIMIIYIINDNNYTNKVTIQITSLPLQGTSIIRRCNSTEDNPDFTTNSQTSLGVKDMAREHGAVGNPAPPWATGAHCQHSR